MATKVIPNYALYGVQAAAGWQTSFDLEWIPQRSRGHHWEIKPHKHDAFMQVQYVTKGSCEVLMDHLRISLRAPCLMLVPANAVHAYNFSEDVDGPVVTAAQQHLESLMSVSGTEMLSVVRKPTIISLENFAGHHELLMPLFLAIEREANSDAFGKAAAGMSLIAALCVQIARFTQHAEVISGKKNTRKTLQIEKLRALVNEHYRAHWPVTAYANELGVTAGQLSRLCREVLGTSVLDVINARLIHEAQRNLIYTTGSIKQMADALGFADEAYFGRFFRKHTGITPTEFRRKGLEGLDA